MKNNEKKKKKKEMTKRKKRKKFIQVINLLKTNLKNLRVTT